MVKVVNMVTSKGIKIRCLTVLVALTFGCGQAISAQKSLNSSHQLESSVSMPKVNKKKKTKDDNGQINLSDAAKAKIKSVKVTDQIRKAEEEKARQDSIAHAEQLKKEQMYKIDYEEVEVEVSMFDQPPMFPGGMSALAQFIVDNLDYPKECEEQKIEGRVTCQMVVTKEGKLVNIKVARGLHPALDFEAVRILKLMPNWQPATLKGEPVNCKYTLPVFMSYRD